MKIGRVLVAAALSAIAMFVWGFVYWGPVLNMSSRLMAPLPEAVELDVLAPLRGEQAPSGMYVYPGPADPDAAAKMTEGPILHMSYHSGGVQPMDPVMLAQGWLHSFVVALLAGTVLSLALPATPTYARRVLLLLLVSLVAALWTNLSDAIWYFYSWPYVLGQVGYGLVSGLLMALITAAIVRPESSHHAPRDGASRGA
jgi:hypothetical protein